MNDIWQLQFLGGLRAQGGGRTIERFRTQKTGALLAYLALHPHQTHSRDVLIELFWPDSEPGAARTNLRVAINSLHRQFGWDGDALVSRSDGARLHPDTFVTDVSVFEQALNKAERADTPADKQRCLNEALRAYGGRLLPHLYDDWAAHLQNRLAEQHLGALMQMLGLCEQAGDITMALDYAHCALAADPFCEPVHAALIRLHTAAHQPAMALRHYQEWERRLRDELGDVPGEEIRRLAAALKAQPENPPRSFPPLSRTPATLLTPGTGGMPDSILHPGAVHADTARHTPAAALPTVAPVPLPLAFTRFFGRIEERETLVGMLQDGARLITMTGPGGAGKTRLALEVAAHFQARRHAHCSAHDHARHDAEHASEFDPGFNVVCFASLADVSEAGRICASVASALGLPRNDGADMQMRVVEHLRAHKTLLILDNYEHLADTGALLVRALLQACAGLSCLVTSRQPLRLEAERQFPIPPLALPLYAGTPERLREFASVQLFVDRAQAVRPDFALTDRNASHVAALCAKLEGVPLALELAAGWAGVLTPAQMLARMERPFDLLVSRHKDISPRHRTLWSALEYSYLLLNKEARRVFACLAVFRGGCTLDAAQSVCADVPKQLAFEQLERSPLASLEPLDSEAVLEAVAQLQEHSLLGVTARAHAPRHRMLETVRAFALEKLRERDEESLVHRRHALFFLDMARQAFGAISTPGQQAHFDRVEADYDNMRAILENPPDAQTALGLVSALGPFWSCRGYVQEGCEHAARVLDRAKGQDFPGLRARALITAGNLANDRGDYAEAIARMEEARALYEEMRHSEGALMCLCNLGRFALHGEQYDHAHTLLTQALALSREQGLRSTEGYMLHNLGELATRRGEWAASLRFHRQEQAIGDEMGDRHLVASSLTGMADAAQGQGDLDQAEALYRQSLQISSETGQRGSLHVPLAGLIRVASARRQWERAACLLGVCSAVSANTGMSLPPFEQAALEECQKQAQAALANAEFARLFARGHDMPLEEAIAGAMQATAHNRR